MKKKIVIAAVIVVLVILVAVLATRKKAPPPALPKVPVTAEKALQKDMPVEIREIGTVEGYRSVPIYSRVVGQLVKIHFKEGQDVKQGTLLFTIDPNSYKEKLRQAEARLAQDTAQLTFAKDEALRYKYLVERGAVALSDYENKQTAANAYDATVAADRAAVEDARLQLAYCSIHAPFDGRMGAYGAYEGRMIKDNDTQLAVINQIVPIYVYFSVPEKELPAIRQHMVKGKLKVTALPPGFAGAAPQGELTFIDNTVNAQTGMIQLKAVFPNKDVVLWPGQFVNVVLTLATEKNATVVPTRAVQLSQAGKYAFVVKPDNTVQYRKVETGIQSVSETVVLKGVSPGETVITDGHLKLKEGFPVEIRDSLLPGQGNAGGAQAASFPAKPGDPAGKDK